MGGKKKAGGSKKKEDEEDVSVEQFYKFYKKKCNELACPFSSIIKEKFAEYEEDGTTISKVSS